MAPPWNCFGKRLHFLKVELFFSLIIMFEKKRYLWAKWYAFIYAVNWVTFHPSGLLTMCLIFGTLPIDWSKDIFLYPGQAGTKFPLW